ncbi:MAG: hypothetical protein ACW99V_04475 [Candidatus Thorarchaeota archaeon]
MMTFKGKIQTTQLGVFGKKEIQYGYITILTRGNKHVKIKVDSYTWYETLEIGQKVDVEAEKLGNTDIWVARKILSQEKIPVSKLETKDIPAQKATN